VRDLGIIEYFERHMLDGKWVNLRDVKRGMHIGRRGMTSPEADDVLQELSACGVLEFEVRRSVSRRKRVRVIVKPWHDQRHVVDGSINMDCGLCREDIQTHADWCQTAQLRDL
jgi:hypothetical protein